MSITQLTGVLLISVPIAFNVFFTLLGRFFNYPDILRPPTADVLKRFSQGGLQLIRLWYGFTLSAVLFAPVVVLTHQVLIRDDTAYLWLASTIGVLAAAMQFLIRTVSTLMIRKQLSPFLRAIFLLVSLLLTACGPDGPTLTPLTSITVLPTAGSTAPPAPALATSAQQQPAPADCVRRYLRGLRKLVSPRPNLQCRIASAGR